MKLKMWPLISSKREKSYRIFNLRTDRSLSPRTEKEHDFYVLETHPWVNVIPVTREKEVVMIRQYRHGIRDITLEIPGGLVEPSDTPEGAALRELQEETGYVGSRLVSLGWVHPNPAILNNICYTFLALDVFEDGAQMLDEKEDIEVVLHPLDSVPRLIREGVITHSLVIDAFYRLFMEYSP